MISVRSGNTVVTIYPPKDGNRFAIVYHEGGKHRKIETRYTINEAKDRASELAKLIESRRLKEIHLTQADIDELQEARRILAPHNISLLVAARECIAYRQEKSCKQVPVTQAVAEFVASKNRPEFNPVYRTNLKQHLQRFAESFPKQTIDSLSTRDIERWLDGLEVKGRTRENYRTFVTMLFRFARKCGYIPKGETAADSIERIPFVTEEIVVFSPADLRKLLAAAEPSDRLYIAIRCFAGIRGAELARQDVKRRLAWEDIRWEEPAIYVSKGKSKTRAHRSIPIEPNLAAWLVPYRGSTGPIMPRPVEDEQRVIQARLDRLAAALGIEWKRNGFRRGYATYLYKLTENENLVCSRTGHDPNVFMRDYRHVAVSKVDAKEWFSIMPESENCCTAVARNAVKT